MAIDHDVLAAVSLNNDSQLILTNLEDQFQYKYSILIQIWNNFIHKR